LCLLVLGGLASAERRAAQDRVDLVQLCPRVLMIDAGRRAAHEAGTGWHLVPAVASASLMRAAFSALAGRRPVSIIDSSGSRMPAS
jgi:hypothetical protein